MALLFYLACPELIRLRNPLARADELRTFMDENKSKLKLRPRTGE
jgi:hypothetical protein